MKKLGIRGEKLVILLSQLGIIYALTPNDQLELVSGSKKRVIFSLKALKTMNIYEEILRMNTKFWLTIRTLSSTRDLAGSYHFCWKLTPLYVLLNEVELVHLKI